MHSHHDFYSFLSITSNKKIIFIELLTSTYNNSWQDLNLSIMHFANLAQDRLDLNSH